MADYENYKKQIVTFDVKKMMLLSLVMFIVPAVACTLLAFFVVNKGSLSGAIKVHSIIFVIIDFIVLLFLHEGLHAFGFAVFGKAKRSEIAFGIVPKQGMLYCTCKKPLTRNVYLTALILPLVITGIIPLIIVTCLGKILYIFLFSFMVSGGAGDIIMFIKVMKYPSSQLILDHPKAPAYYLLYEEGKTPEGFTEATEEQEKEIIESLNKPIFGNENKKNSILKKILSVLLFIIVFVFVGILIGYIISL